MAIFPPDPLPEPIQATFLHITLQLGSTIGCANCPAIHCAVDTAATLATGKGSTKSTLPGIVLIQIVYFFHVFHRSLVLILPVPRVPEYQGDQFFSDLGFFLAVVLCTNWCTTICISVQIYAKLYRCSPRSKSLSLNIE
jgi:hypothetical protein